VNFSASVTSDFDEIDLAEMARQKALSVAKERAGEMRCGVHGKEPDITLDGDKLHISACCQDFAAEVGEAVSD
jgi:hypothetical protein